MGEIDIGLGKSARPAYGLADLELVPARRTRDPEDVDISWQVDAFRFDTPVVAAAMDSVCSPATAIELGRQGALGVLNLEGVWTRYEDAAAVLAEISMLGDNDVAQRLQEIYAAPIRVDLLIERIAQIRAAGVTAAGAVTPQRAVELLPAIRKAEVDILLIQGTIVSAEHVARTVEPLNLKTFIRQLDLPVLVGGCVSYQAALHLMRTGAAGVLVGVGAGSTSTTSEVLGVGVPLATAIADVRAARMRHLDETGVYCHVVADGGIRSGGDIAKAIACGADAVMVGAGLAAASQAPGSGRHWSKAGYHATLPRGRRTDVQTLGTLAEILHGPAVGENPGLNLCGGLRRSMAYCGFATLKELQKAELVISAVGGR